MTHVWQKCYTSGEANWGALPDAQAADQSAGYGSYLTTYSQRYAVDNGCKYVPFNSTNEDHAETISLFLNLTSPEITCGNGKPNPYHDGRFPNHYKLAQQGLGAGNGQSK
jgi:hypothetical protein